MDMQLICWNLQPLRWSKGSPKKPFTPEEHMKKLDDLTTAFIGKEQAMRLWALVDEMKPDRPASEVMALVLPGA